MPRLEEATLLAFRDELQKTAFAVPWKALGGNVGSLMGVGAGVGAAVQGARAGYRGYEDAKEQGAGSISAGLSGLAHGAMAAPGGALAGAAVGGLAGGAGTFMAPERTGQLAKTLTQGEHAGALGRFGQRQVHGLTGWTPEGGLSSIRGGSWLAEDRMRKAVSSATGDAKTTKALRTAIDSHTAAAEAERMGLTNIPGLAKSLARSPIKTMRAAGAEQWHNSSKAEKALLFGLPAAGAVSTALTPETEGGPGKGEMLGRSAAQFAGGMAMGPMPFVASGLAQGALTPIGGAIGKGVDRLRGRKPPAHRPLPEQPADGASTATERVLSNSAAGLPPEGSS